MLILPKHSIDKKNTFLPILPNTYAILKSDDFKNTIFKNAIFKIALIEIALPNEPLCGFWFGVKFVFLVSKRTRDIRFMSFIFWYMDYYFVMLNC
jgi:hypothetical protein